MPDTATNKPAPAPIFGKKKAPVKPVRKPYLQGAPWSKGSLRRVLKVFGTIAAFVLIALFFGGTAGMGSTFLRWLINGVLLLGFWYVLFAEGVADGDSDVALGEINYQRVQEGKTVSETDRKRGFHPLKGFLNAFLGALPFMILMLIYAVNAEKQVYTLQSLPSWVTSYQGVEEIGGGLGYYNVHAEAGLTDYLRVFTRLVCMPYVNLVSTKNADALLLLDRLSPLTMLPPILALGLGYLRGPHSRAMVHGNIQANNRRRARRERKLIRKRSSAPREIV